MTGEYVPGKAPQVYYHPKDKKLPLSERRVILRRTHERCMVVSRNQLVVILKEAKNLLESEP